ncbi:MAG: flagellar basal body-associated FliL family protein [Candidatus Puniceispirillaceae bacterium]|jgi:flagellar basal body-associated protein FliL
MAEIEAEQQKPKKRLSLSGLFLPLLIGATISIIVVFFVVGYISLTEPPPPPEDIHSLMNKKQQEDAATPADNSTENAPEMVVNEDGTFDFAQYRYFSFPLPFVVNFADGNGMMTVEIAIATYETTLRGEQLIEKLTTFTPKMRSAINLVLAEQIHDAVNTVAKRKALEKRLLATIKPVIDGTNPERPSGITDLYFTKFVISNTR